MKLYDDEIEMPSVNEKYGSVIVRTLIIAVTILLCALFTFLNYQRDNSDNDIQSFNIGNVWTAPDLVAGYNFAIIKPDQQYRAEIQNAKDSISPIFIKDTYAESNLIGRINDIVDDLLESNDSTLINYVSADKIHRFFMQSENVRSREATKIRFQLIPFIQNIYKRGYVNRQPDSVSLNDFITVRTLPNNEYVVEKESVYNKQKYSVALQEFTIGVFNQETAELITSIIFKISQPNLIFSEALTDEAENYAEHSVRQTLGIVHKDEIIIKNNERITEENLQKIKSYSIADEAQGSSTFSYLKIVGNIGHAAIQCSILFLYLFIGRKKIWHNNYKMAVLSVPLVITAFLGWLTFQLQSSIANVPFEYLVLIPALSMFVAIIFDSRTAFRATVSMALIIAGVRGNDYFLGLTMLFTGTIAAYAVKDIQDRTQIFTSIIFIFIGFTLSIFAIGLERGYGISMMAPQLFLALINAIIAPVITFLLLLFINRYNHTFMNNLWLQTYTNKEHPIITELKEKAPGTYEHSRQIGMLGAACATAIDANPLLITVGAMFHDIGKMLHPEIYTENKEYYKAAGDPYKDMTPLESARTIMQHVTEGAKLARSISLHQSIIDFIEQHHGTTLVKHFYNVAVNEAKEKHIKVDENDFRYPGPKPQNKETAILMIADFAEAISKSAKDIEQFDALFQTNLKERILDGQFDEANITLNEIRTIANVLLDEIKGKLSTRVQYATLDESEDKDEQQPTEDH
jgi:putative nucleotidyltransferase with HDIG domain